jgi:TPP-dependent 2-oxoacid decarboxylase
LNKQQHFTSSRKTVSIGNYLIERLYNYGVRHIFGVPGDFILGFFNQLMESKIKVINTCDEQAAGFAADAYARINGLGVVCVTYCVGGLKVVNPTAEAFAEKSPLIIISGSPGIKERRKDPLLHHKVKNFDTQSKVFEEITVASVIINNPQTAAQEIDRILNAALSYKRPVYIELPRDIVSVDIFLDASSNNTDPQMDHDQEKSDPTILSEALHETIDMINSSTRPVIVAGVEIQRFGLQNELLHLIEKLKIPVSSTILSKSVISELHPLYLGLYEGALGHDSVREYVESSDCLILLGALMTDIDLGGFTAKIDQKRSIYINSEKFSVRYHNYEEISLKDFIVTLIESTDIKERKEFINNPISHNPQSFCAIKGQKITIKRLFQCINSFLKDDMIVLADIGDALFGGTDLVIHRKTEFLSPAYYASMGFAVPASIGTQLANPKLRPLVIVGDGAFQMTGMEISTALRFNLNPIVIVLNNGGYGTERSILDGSFNDIPTWKYNLIPKIVGGGKGFIVETEEQFEDALLYAESNTECFCILDIHIDINDKSPALQRLTETLRKSAF